MEELTKTARDETTHAQIVGPTRKGNKLAYDKHFSPWERHNSQTRMMRLLKETYLWLSMRRDINQISEECLTCQRRRPKHELSYDITSVLNSPEVFHIVALDIIGPVRSFRLLPKQVFYLKRH